MGRWEGDTLVLDSISFVDTTWLGRGGFFHSTEMHVVEKFTRQGDVILYDVTVEDPEVLVEPWVLPTRTLRRNTNPDAGLMRERGNCESLRDRRHLPRRFATSRAQGRRAASSPRAQRRLPRPSVATSRNSAIGAKALAAVLVACLGIAAAHAGTSETTGAMRVRVASSPLLSSGAVFELRTADGSPSSRTAELHDARLVALFPSLLPGIYRFVARLQGFRSAEVDVSVAPGTIAEVVVEFCELAAACTESRVRVTHTDALGHGYAFDRTTLATFPGDDAASSVVETTIASAIVDRMSTGGLWAREAALIGGPGSSWRQTTLRLGDADVTDPGRIGTPLARLHQEATESLHLLTAILPSSVSGPGPALTVIPKLPSNTWRGATSSISLLQRCKRTTRSPVHHRSHDSRCIGTGPRRSEVHLGGRQEYSCRHAASRPIAQSATTPCNFERRSSLSSRVRRSTPARGIEFDLRRRSTARPFHTLAGRASPTVTSDNATASPRCNRHGITGRTAEARGLCPRHTRGATSIPSYPSLPVWTRRRSAPSSNGFAMVRCLPCSKCFLEHEGHSARASTSSRRDY